MEVQNPKLSALLSKEKQKILACVHCGLCLESCPTYRATGNENDGPRGRIYLMRAVEEGKLNPDSAAFERHIDRCLGCRACEQVCPSGVEYGNLLELSRAEIRAARKSRGIFYSLQSWLLRSIWPYPGRLGLLFWLARSFRETRLLRLALKSGIPEMLSHRLAFAFALLEASRPVKLRFSETLKPATGKFPKTGKMTECRAEQFSGCVTAGLFGRVNKATVRVLQHNGFNVDVPQGQTCCGALHLHSGDIEGARELARRNIGAFNDHEAEIVTNAGGCGAMLVNYGHLLADDPEFAEPADLFSSRVKDISQVIDLEAIDDRCQIEGGPVTYDASCHLLHGQKAGSEARRLVASVAGEKFVSLGECEVCCGGAGVYNLLEPDLASRVLHEKLNNVRATGAELLATGNPGCHMQIGAGALMAGTGLKVCHPIEILDAFYERAGVYERDQKASGSFR